MITNNPRDLVKQITTVMNELTQYGRHSHWNVFEDVMHILAITLHNNKSIFDQTREDTYMRYVDKYGGEWLTKCSTLIFAPLIMFFNDPDNRDDILGMLFHELELHNKYRGQFFTPFHISAMIAHIVSVDISSHISKKGFATLSEPTCGSGGMVLAYEQAIRKNGFDPHTQLVVVAQDIDPKCVHMTYIQLTLCGISAVVQRGNTLANEVLDSWYTPAFMLNDGLGKLGRMKPVSKRRRTVIKNV